MNDTITKVNGFAKGEYPDLLINLKPQEESDYQVKYTDVAMGIESPAIKAGGILVSLWINVASIPWQQSAHLAARSALLQPKTAALEILIASVSASGLR